MSITRFFTQALGAALELGVASPEDLLKHITPPLLAQHLPRPLWARLLTACLGAERTDAALIVDTVGVANLCEHMPAPVLWACLAEVAERAIGRSLLVAPPPSTGVGAPGSIGAAVGGSPLAAAPLPAPSRRDEPAADPGAGSTSRARSNSRQPFRSVGSSPGGGRAPSPAPTPARPAQPGAASATSASSPASSATAAAVAARRPQAAAGRASTAIDFDIDTDVRSDWKGKDGEVAAEVDDDQLVDWSANEETVTAGPNFDRKR